MANAIAMIRRCAKYGEPAQYAESPARATGTRAGRFDESLDIIEPTPSFSEEPMGNGETSIEAQVST